MNRTTGAKTQIEHVILLTVKATELVRSSRVAGTRQTPATSGIDLAEVLEKGKNTGWNWVGFAILPFDKRSEVVAHRGLKELL